MKKSGGALMSMLNLDRQSDTTLTRQLENKIRKAVLDGTLPQGTRLPSTRQLAKDLGVSRLTTKNAFEQLKSEGYLETRHGSGTYVEQLSAGDLPVYLANRRRKRPLKSNVVSSQVMQFRKSLATTRLSNVSAFRPGIPALDLFPRRAWAEVQSRAIRNYDDTLLGYGPSGGLEEFKSAIATHVRDNRGIECATDQIVVTSSAQQAFTLIFRSLLAPEKSIWMEDPGHIAFREAAQLHGYDVKSVPLDDEGFSLEFSLTEYGNCNLIFVTPSHQHPMGMTMSLPRRLDLLDVAHSLGSWIIEDDYDSAFHYEERPQPALKALDKQGRVFYVGSFSKTMFPAIRLGYLICPPGLGAAFADSETLLSNNVSSLQQKAMTYFMTDGSFNAHIRRMKQAYRSRRDVLIAEIESQAGHLLCIEPCHAGMHIVMQAIEKNVPDQELARNLWESGVDCLPLSIFCDTAKTSSGILFGFACCPENEMNKKVATAVQCLEFAIEKG